jgi:hypothetical protein
MAITTAGVMAAAAVGSVIVGQQNAKRAADAQERAANAAANQTVEQIDHLSPVEQQAMGMQGYMGAQDWRSMHEMTRQQSMYGGGAQYGQNFLQPGQAALQTANSILNVGSGYDRDGEYAAYDLLRKSRTSVMKQIEMLGIDDGTGRNPYGVKITYDEYENLMRAKDPAQHIGAGTSLGDPASPEEIMAAAKLANPAAADGNPVWGDRYGFLEKMSGDMGMGGETLKAMAADPKHADAINYWKTQGVIDAQMNVNQGQLLDHMEKFQVGLIQNRTMQPMSPDQQIGYKDAYTASAGKVVDPKLVKIEDLGDGVQRTTIMNADGTTPAGSFLSGSITLPNGQTVDKVSFQGANRKDWAQYQQAADRTGSLFSDAFNAGADERDVTPASQGGGSGGGGSKAGAGGATPPGYKGASLSGGPSMGGAPPPQMPLDPRSIPGYESGLSYMGGFPGGVPPIGAENQARSAQGMPQIGGGPTPPPRMSAPMQGPSPMAMPEGGGQGGGMDPEAMFQQMMSNPQGQKQMMNFFQQMMSKQGGQ